VHPLDGVGVNVGVAGVVVGVGVTNIRVAVGVGSANRAIGLLLHASRTRVNNRGEASLVKFNFFIFDFLCSWM
jgi:hypothetical protein